MRRHLTTTPSREQASQCSPTTRRNSIRGGDSRLCAARRHADEMGRADADRARGVPADRSRRLQQAMYYSDLGASVEFHVEFRPPRHWAWSPAGRRCGANARRGERGGRIRRHRRAPEDVLRRPCGRPEDGILGPLRPSSWKIGFKYLMYRQKLSLCAALLGWRLQGGNGLFAIRTGYQPQTNPINQQESIRNCPTLGRRRKSRRDGTPSDVRPISITDEMKRSYLDYAMSVIVSRALPDVRDGLKPVHRRILYSMHEQRLYARQAVRQVGARRRRRDG